MPKQSFKISNSALDCYLQCPKKYKFQYVDKLKADVTKSPLLFGSAIDAALNYILESIRDKKAWNIEDACSIFSAEMDKWKGQNRLDFFKNEVPDELKDSVDPDNQEHQEAVWSNLCKRGIDCLFVYDKEIIPLIDEVLHVQARGSVPNEEGDEFVFVVDFIAKLKDGRTVLFDNKTASAKYPKNKVVKSQQLSFYIEQFPEIKLAGYIVLIKDPSREKGLTHQILIDEIPEETRAESFDKLDNTMYVIKQGEFPCNYKACKSFGKPCDYEKLCSYGDPTGLISTKKKEDIDK